MPRQRSPNRDKAFRLWQESGGTIELVDIAKQLNAPEGTIIGWKKKDKWDSNLNGTFQTNTERSEPKKNTVKAGKSLVESVMANDALTEKQRLFCVYYAKCFNATKAYQKAYGCGYETAGSNGYALLQKTAITEEIKRLKQHRLNQAMLEPGDIFQKYMDIAFADMTDFVSFGQEEVQVTSAFGPVKDVVNVVKLHPSETVDGTLITEIKQGKDGVGLKLADRMKALDWLTNHMDLATEEQRARINKLKADADKGNVDKTIHVTLSSEVEQYAD